jgi:preprotein translocase subunit SecF
VVSLFTRGLNLGLDFKGGVAWEAPAKNGLTTKTAKDIISANGINAADAKIQTLNSQSEGERIRVQVGDQTADVKNKVQQALADKAGVDIGLVNVTAVSSSWGAEITKKAVTALVVFFFAIALYISLRFEWRMAVGALAAVVHDVAISVGVYSVTGFEVTPATVIAFLTILGYSLYDTIVVFDKVHDNTRRLASGRVTYGDIVNLSMNQVLMRSINTSLAAILPVASLLVVGAWILGAIALQDFALALLVGLITGSYSSIFIATPILAALKEREPRYKALKDRLGSTTGDLAAVRAGVRTLAPTPSAAAAPDAVVAASTRAGAYTHPPRPRKKKRR